MNPVRKGGVQKTLAEHIKNNSVRTWPFSDQANTPMEE